MGGCLSSPAKDGGSGDHKPAQPAAGIVAPSTATSVKAEAGSAAAVSDVASSSSGNGGGGSDKASNSTVAAAQHTDAQPRSAAAGMSAEGDEEGSRKASAAIAISAPAGAGRLDRSSGAGDVSGTSPDSSSRGTPLLSRISLTGLTRTSTGGGVGEYLRRHSTEGIRKQIDTVKRVNQSLAEKAHGKDDSGDHAVASIDPSIYY